MSLILHFIYSFFATVGFAVVFNTPKKSLIYGGLCGGTGWTVYTALQPLISPAPANLIAAISVAALGELFALINKNPVTAFVIPGIIPLVPGYGIYSTMLNLLQNNLEQGLSLGLNTIFNSGAIAIGVILVSSIAKILKRKNTKKPMTLPRI